MTWNDDRTARHPHPHPKDNAPMTAAPMTDTADRFALGTRNGEITPTAQPIADTPATPFALSLRAPAIPADGSIATAGPGFTEKTTNGGRFVDTSFDL